LHTEVICLQDEAFYNLFIQSLHT